MEKTKHRFNIIDIIIILLVIAAVVLAVKIWIIDDRADVKSKNSDVQFVICTDAISEELSDNVVQGDKIYDYSSGTELGKVTACDVRNATYTGKGSDGSSVTSEIVGKKVLYITVEATASVSDDGYKIGEVPISVGNKYSFMLPHLFCNASCISVEVIG